jgi:hypothetical protein
MNLVSFSIHLPVSHRCLDISRNNIPCTRLSINCSVPLTEIFRAHSRAASVFPFPVPRSPRSRAANVSRVPPPSATSPCVACAGFLDASVTVQQQQAATHHHHHTLTQISGGIPGSRANTSTFIGVLLHSACLGQGEFGGAVGMRLMSFPTNKIMVWPARSQDILVSGLGVR